MDDKTQEFISIVSIFINVYETYILKITLGVFLLLFGISLIALAKAEEELEILNRDSDQYKFCRERK